jgi:hypothetical protein
VRAALGAGWMPDALAALARRAAAPPRESCYAVALRPHRFIRAARTTVTHCEGSLDMRLGEIAPNTPNRAQLRIGVAHQASLTQIC